MGVFAQPVPTNVLVYQPGQHGYASLAATMLAGLGDKSDTFDSDLSVTVQSLAQHDSVEAASDQAFSDFASAASAVVDSGIDDLASDLGAFLGLFGPAINAVNGANQALQNPFQMPAAPSSVAIPDFNVSTGIPAPIPPVNPPQSGPPDHPPSPPPPPINIGPGQGEPYPTCTYLAPASNPGCGGNGNDEPCIDIWGLPIGCGGQQQSCIPGSYEGSGMPPLPFCP